jgi:hypothetical protein
MLLLRWKILPTLPPNWKQSVFRPSNPGVPYVRLGVVAAAVVIAALVSLLGRSGTVERVERPKAVAVATPATIIPPAPSNEPAQKVVPPESGPTAMLPQVETLPQEAAVSTAKEVIVPIDPRKLMNLMNAGVTKYTSERGEANKVNGAQLIQLAALLGYETARNLVVVNYPRAASMRTAVPAPDAILYAGDLLARRTDADPQFVALANYFSSRGESLAFAKILVDVIRDNARLREPEHLERLFNALKRVPGACSAVKRAVLGDPAIDENDCSDSLRQVILIYATAKGPAGSESDARDRGLEMMQKADAAQQAGATGAK